MPLVAIILAAGQGTRFKSKRAKVLHPLLGRPMILYPIDLAQGLDPDRLIVVVGHQAEAVQEVCPDGVEFVLQAEQKGTGHAVACALEALTGFEGEVLILSGDVPLLRPETATSFIEAHQAASATVSLIIARLDDPTGYGRVLRQGGRLAVIEEKDASFEQRQTKEINAGLYLIRAGFLSEALEELRPHNAQAEYYLPDVIRLAAEQGLDCLAFEARDSEEVMGINDRWQLAQAEKRLRLAKVKEMMLAGVGCQDPESVFIEAGVKVGRRSWLGAGVHLLGRCSIGRGVIIEPNCLLIDVTIGDGATIRFGARLEGVTIEAEALVEA
ncbi:MAG: bifunctional N-acetylglucosamine-1-phosphate uridyltransferase/glucosamine-1-phosphate acetyltransferase [Deltaproteobacteria bacterium]|nr:bifunctional N-acetylglucosamine-1-phosphate uridyltransferase/glucosamine-1-phosphate acetyltransferase [Deltaproteobacteria bacterium]